MCHLYLCSVSIRIVTDINLEQTARVESKTRKGSRFDWSNQYAVKDRVVSRDLNDQGPQESLASLDLSLHVIPSATVLSSLRTLTVFVPLVYFTLTHTFALLLKLTLFTTQLI